MFATVELSCASNEDTRYCINEAVQYQCDIPGDSLVTMIWRVLNGSDQLGESYVTNGDLNENDPDTISGDFATVLTSNGDPLTSTISYTVSASHDGYSIECEQFGVTSKTCSINIEGMSRIY